MKLNKLKQWTKEEDDILRVIFENTKFRGNHEGGTHYKIKKRLEKKGIIRTEKAVARRLNRLGLKFYEVKDKDQLIKCIDCNKSVLVSKRYLNREKNNKKYCSDCVKNHKHDWDKLHKEEVTKYQREYQKLNKKSNSVGETNLNGKKGNLLLLSSL
jgi:hypothetical protein